MRVVVISTVVPKGLEKHQEEQEVNDYLDHSIVIIYKNTQKIL